MASSSPPSDPSDPRSGAGSTRPRIQNACEACRASKLKCQASRQQGICKRCLEHKRECVYRTGPRTRRPRVPKANETLSRPPPPPPGPSKTFSIDFPVQAEPDVADDWGDLFKSHHRYIDHIVPPSPMEPYPASLPTPSGATTTGNRLSCTTHYGMKPQFNLASATSLLDSFRSMLSFFPVLYLPPEATVTSLSKSSPFVLLAILAASSGSKSIQGYNLYDEEFRKVLGLKYVAGGERSVELLLGLLVYCAWYPFHLRPRSNQARRYVQFVVDLMKEIEMVDSARREEVEAMELEKVRALVGAYYLVSSFQSSWCKPSMLKLTHRLRRCCNRLESEDSSVEDKVLALMARTQHIMEEVGELRAPQTSPIQTAFQAEAILLGMEAQYWEMMSHVPVEIASQPAIQLVRHYTPIFFNTAPLLRLPIPKAVIKTAESMSLEPILRADPARLTAVIAPLKDHLNRLYLMLSKNVRGLTCVDWGRFVHCIILGVRLSFPLPGLDEWDHKGVREKLDFLNFANLICASGDGEDGGSKDHDSGHESSTPDDPAHSCPSTKILDEYGACRLIMGVIRTKYLRKLGLVEARERELAAEREKLQAQDAAMSGMQCPVSGAGQGGLRGLGHLGRIGCPVMDGSLDSFLPLWEGGNMAVDLAGMNLNGTTHPPVGCGASGTSGSGTSDAMNLGLEMTGSTSVTDSSSMGLDITIDALGTPSTGDEGLNSAMESSGRDFPEIPTADGTKVGGFPLFHDLWATMTMGWGGQGAGAMPSDAEKSAQVL